MEIHLLNVFVILSFFLHGRHASESVEERLRKLEIENQVLRNHVNKLGQRIDICEQSILEIVSSAENSTRKLPTNVSAKEFQQQDRSPRAALAGTVAFYAYLSSTRCYSNHQIIVYDVEVTDTSGSYNKYDGIFSAPVTGTYAFAVTIVPILNKWVTCEIISDGHVFGGAIGDSEGESGYHPGSITVVVHLQAGAHIYVRKASASDTCATQSVMPFVTSFAGWLIG